MGLLVLACVVAGAGTASAEKRVPGVYVTLACPSVDDTERTTHIDHIKTRLGASSLLENKHVDVNVTRLVWATNGNSVEVHVDLAFVMSTRNNEIVSVANQTAKLTMSKTQFREGKLPTLRREVIDNALGDLLVKLRRATARNV